MTCMFSEEGSLNKANIDSSSLVESTCPLSQQAPQLGNGMKGTGIKDKKHNRKHLPKVIAPKTTWPSVNTLSLPQVRAV